MDPATLSALISGGSALVGAGMNLFGKKKQAQLTPTIPPEMMARQQKAWQMGLGGMEDPYKGFDPIAQQARSQFQTQTLPSIAERFTSMGQGGQRSSDFAGALGQSGADLEGNILAQRSQYGLQRMGQLQQLMGMGMGSGADYLYQPEQPGSAQQFGAQLFGGSMKGLQSSLGMMDSSRAQGRLRADKQAQQERSNQTRQQVMDMVANNPDIDPGIIASLLSSI